MSENILVPVLGESITEATVSTWLKNEGDVVDADEPIVELETDKVNLEVPSPVSGVLTKINSKDGEVVEVGSLLGSVSENGSKISKIDKEIKTKPILEENNIVKLEIQKTEPEIFDEQQEEQQQEEQPLVLTNEIKIDDKIENLKTEQLLSPAVRKIVSENKIDIKSVKGSGKDGRVLKGDLINLMGVNPQPSERKKKIWSRRKNKNDKVETNYC